MNESEAYDNAPNASEGRLKDHFRTCSFNDASPQAVIEHGCHAHRSSLNTNKKVKTTITPNSDESSPSSESDFDVCNEISSAKQ